MKRLLFILLIAINSCFIYAQVPFILEGSVIKNSETGTWYGVNIPRHVPTKLIYRNNSITSVNTDGYLLQAGDENPSVRDNNLDNMEISGNQFIWNGVDDPTIITHGILTGYNINSVIKYNKLINVPYGIIFKSGTDDGANMTFTSGGCAYNICKNGKFAVRMKGINGVKIYNNTFYSDNVNSRYLLLITSNQDRAKPVPSTGSKVYNNIFFTSVKIPMISLESGSLLGFESDYNVFWSTHGEPTFAIDGVTYTWQQWTAMGYDTHSKVINPKFKNTTDFVPEERLDFGINLGKEWEAGLAPSATWVPGKSPLTANQDEKWQVGAIIVGTKDGEPVPGDADSFKIYPNPSNGAFKLEVNNMPEEGVTVELKNVHGQILLEKKTNENISNWSVNQYFGSVFFITVTGPDFTSTKRIILNKHMD